MADNKEKKGMSDWWRGLNAEWNKIVWADGETVRNQTTAVCIVSVILAALIVLFDMVIQFGVDKLINL
jgi:preprotein translocase subunit SecE